MSEPTLAIRHKPVSLHDKQDALQDKIDAVDCICIGEPPSLTPQDKRDDAVLADVQTTIAAGERLAEVVKQLKNERMNLREFQRANPTIFRAGLIMRLRDIIEFAEADDA